ncbi:ancillary SecYEG translocon subunit YfgM [Orbus sasakiae]|uniref:Ancillary SecYEG translocon subunit n=1 Tax=Orbus sasakiae TaxID=1078475 RepID=A0ABP9N9I5_9GAMM
MSHSDSEEQVQEIKEFLAKTWKIIVAVIVIGLLAVWGWRYWQSHQSGKMVDASDQYELLISKLNPADPASVDQLVTFAKDNNNIYSVFANLKAAQFYVEVRKDYTGAETLLADAIKKTDAEPVQAIINIRIARLQYQLEKYDDSLASLAKVTDQSWAASVNDIRGDVLVKMKKYAEACDAYQVALASSPTPELDVNLKMKLNQAEYLKVQQEQNNS